MKRKDFELIATALNVAVFADDANPKPTKSAARMWRNVTETMIDMLETAYPGKFDRALFAQQALGDE
jgi:hypothetical protein